MRTTFDEQAKSGENNHMTHTRTIQTVLALLCLLFISRPALADADMKPALTELLKKSQELIEQVPEDGPITARVVAIRLEAFTELSVSYSQLGDKQNAATNLEKAQALLERLRDEPKLDADCRHRLVQAYLAVNDVTSATTLVQTITEGEPATLAYGELAIDAHQRGDIEKANVLLTQALTKAETLQQRPLPWTAGPDQAKAELAIMLAEAGLAEKASDLAANIESALERAHAFAGIALAESRQGRDEQASRMLQLSDKAWQLTVQETTRWRSPYLPAVYARLGETEQAEATVKIINQTWAWLLLAEAQADMGKQAEAKTTLERAETTFTNFRDDIARRVAFARENKRLAAADTIADDPYRFCSDWYDFGKAKAATQGLTGRTKEWLQAIDKPADRAFAQLGAVRQVLHQLDEKKSTENTRANETAEAGDKAVHTPATPVDSQK